MRVPAKILVVRNDRLGDFMLAYPTFIFLKQALPDTAIHALVPAYTREMALCCSGIDAVELDPGPAAPVTEQLSLWRRVRQARYDAVLTLFSTTRIGWISALAGIPYRLAPATKFAAVFYNKHLMQRRSRSLKPEYVYNLDLAAKLLADLGLAHDRLPSPPYLSFPAHEVAALAARFRQEHGIGPDDRLIFIHPGSGGSAGNLSVEQYAAVAHGLTSAQPFTIVITAGPGEEASAARLSALLGSLRHVVYHSRTGLRQFAQHIQFCDVWISGSTGPLHVAGALDRPTVAFYTRRRSATSLRWQTLNSPSRRLAFSPPETAAAEDMQAVDINAAIDAINRAFLCG